MGLKDSSSQTTQTSQTNPWDAAMPEVSGLLSGLQGQIGNVGLTGPESGAINQLTATGQAGNPYAGGIGGVATNLLGGGGAAGQIPALQQNLGSYQSNLAPYLDPNYSTVNSPAVRAALNQVQSDVTNQVNGQFAAGGRLGSGMNTQTLARGIAQGEAPIILNQANADTQNRIAAANSLYGAGNTTSNAISGLTQVGNANQQAGINAANSALTASQWGPQQIVAAQELAKSIPSSNLGLLAQIGIPLAELGQTSSGTSNTKNTASTLTGLQQGFGMLGSGPSTAANGATSAGSGILGLLGML